MDPSDSDVRRFSNNPIDFVRDYRKNSTVYMFWFPDIKRILNVKKMIATGVRKRNAVNFIGKYLIAAVYRNLVTSAFKGKRPHQYIEPKIVVALATDVDASEDVMEVEATLVPSPIIDIQWLLMEPDQRAWVYEKIMTVAMYFKSNPDPLTPFIEDPMRKRKLVKYQRSAQNHATKYFNWDLENIHSRRKIH